MGLNHINANAYWIEVLYAVSAKVPVPYGLYCMAEKLAELLLIGPLCGFRKGTGMTHIGSSICVAISAFAILSRRLLFGPL
jgi:hypothetical protein